MVNVSNFVRKISWATAFIFFVIGAASGWLVFRFKSLNDISTGDQLRDKDKNYALISPLLACISPSKELFGELKPLEKELASFVDDQIKKGNAEKIAVYYRDLQNGHWTGVNEDDKFFPASLLKVPIMMAYFKKAESDQDLLDKTVYIAPTVNIQDSKLGIPSKIKTGQSYTLRTIIDYMIVDSDNVAKDALMTLLDSVDKDVLTDIFADLGIDNPGSVQESESYSISARKYSLLFRTLYNATVLNKGMSEKALELLSKTKFSAGLSAGLPSSVTVAHKYGSHVGPPIGTELHDCGIVYSKNPYFLCVMTKGSDPTKLSSVISEISSTVYKEVAN
jgi:beta-lactamase class A